jgi:hypothetical protein
LGYNSGDPRAIAGVLLGNSGYLYGIFEGNALARPGHSLIEPLEPFCLFSPPFKPLEAAHAFFSFPYGAYVDPLVSFIL